MKSDIQLISFPQQNCVFAKDQPEYRQLPAHKVVDSTAGEIIFCWKLSWAQRIKVLFTGKLWHRVLTFEQPLQPQLLEVNIPFK
jgi:hypothetical protein